MSDYEVGYKKPPKSKQFQKGQSGNPKGRSKKSPEGFMAYLSEELNRTIRVQENGKTRSMKKVQAIAIGIINGTLKGDAKALAVLGRYLPELAKYQSIMNPPVIGGTVEIVEAINGRPINRTELKQRIRQEVMAEFGIDQGG